MVVAHCDICLRLVELLIFPGCRAFVRVSISEIFRRAIPGGGLILAHNHPSGKIEPSPADLNLTKRVHLVAEALEIVLLDHLIIGAEAMFSFRRAGLI